MGSNRKWKTKEKLRGHTLDANIAHKTGEGHEVNVAPWSGLTQPMAQEETKEGRMAGKQVQKKKKRGDCRGVDGRVVE